jgi:hypothetical protein
LSYLEEMRLVVGSLVVMLALVACGGGREHVISSNGVRVVAPKDWRRVRPANDGRITDPRTLLVVGTAGVHAKSSQCQIAAYRMPPAGAVVVVVGWTSIAAAGGTPAPGRAPLRKLVAVTKPSFECFAGRGAAADVLLGGRPYQVNVLVADRASERRVAEALAVARSFDRTR